MRGLPVVLLVDDNSMDVELAQDGFAEVSIDLDLRVCRSGRSALDYLLGEGEFADRELHPLPDLVFLDLKMPDVSGADVLKQAKATPVVRRVPILILTSSLERRDLERAYDLGANGYIEKAISYDTFIDVLEKTTRFWLTTNVPPPEAD